MDTTIDKDTARTTTGPMRIFLWRGAAAHTVAYFIAGFAALFTIEYEKRFAAGIMGTLMRPMDSPIVPLGAALQLINGLFISLILYPIRNTFLSDIRTGWLKLFLIVAGFSIFSPQTPGPGTFEGLLYTRIPLALHLAGLPECLLYSFLFSFGLTAWYRVSRNWINTVTIILLILIVLMSTLGYLDSIGALPSP